MVVIISHMLYNCYFLFFKTLYLVTATTGGLLVSLCVYLKLALSLLRPGPFLLITVTLNVFMAYYGDNFYGLYDR